MSEVLLLACWLRSNLLVAAVAVVAILTIATEAAADDDIGALSDRVTKPFTKVLPDTWTSEVKGSRLVLRPRKNPEFVNLVGAAAPQPNETRDDYVRRYVVEFNYRIVLRFESRLSFEEFWSLIRENEGTHYSLQVLERSPHATEMKGSIFFSKTPEGDALAQQRERLLNMSVYVEPTDLGYADFLNEKNRRETQAVEKRIRDQLTPYDVNDQPASKTKSDRPLDRAMAVAEFGLRPEAVVAVHC